MVEETNRNCGGCGDAVHIAKILLSIVWALVLNVYYILQDLFYLIASRPEKIITGQHVLITGAGRGLGREFALRFAKEGCRISCVDVDSEGCTETVKMINEQANAEVAKAYTTDITSQEQISKLAEQMNKDNGPLDILVNNAGIVAAQNILDVPLQGIQKMVDVNLMSHFWTIRQFLPEMKRRKRGHIVAVSSVASFTVAANIAPYTATKCGVTGLMGCLREELRFDYQFVHTTTIHPFFISPPQKYKHWDTKSVLPELTAASVAAIAVDGIKQNKKTVTIPGYMYYTLLLIQALPTKAADLWRDIFFAKIDRPKS